MNIIKLIKSWISLISFFIIRSFPLQNKVVATSFKGKKYGDNPQYIFEELHRICPNLCFYWLVDSSDKYDLPEWITPIEYRRNFRTMFHIYTSKVIIDTHRFLPWVKKRKGQLYIETWHGGLGIKKLEGDVPAFRENKELMEAVRHTNELADVFISQSEHLSNIYRNAFGYCGPIWKVGYPKNDLLLGDNKHIRSKVRNLLNVSEDYRLFLYAPSFRDYFYDNIDASVYDVDYKRLQTALEKQFGGDWVILIRWHPLFAKQLQGATSVNPYTIDVTSYPDMQELLIASDCVLSDYSSCIFDAALLDIPCFTFATDFEKYKEDRGVYYEMEELPFPYARSNDELIANIITFDKTSYLDKWDAFKKRTGLYETGHAAEDIATKIIEFIHTGKTEWK